MFASTHKHRNYGYGYLSVGFCYHRQEMFDHELISFGSNSQATEM